MDEWKNITFSVDLIKAAKYQLDFLKDVDTEGILYSDEILKNAIYRYEKHWLPLCANMDTIGEQAENLYPPLDVAWVWHCHMLSPTEYKKDCEIICGRVIDHVCISKEDRIRKQAYTKKLWEDNRRIAFDYRQFTISLAITAYLRNFTSRFRYDIVGASNRQKSFFYQVSMPHFQNIEYLKMAHDRYMKFLHLKRMNPTVFVVPCFAIDLLWHTHQLNPVYYERDTTKILGYLFPHDDTVNDRTPGSKLCVSDQETRALWSQMFKENFFFPGAMFRGEPPSAEHYSDVKVEYHLFYCKYGYFHLSCIQLTPVNHDFKGTFKLKINRLNEYIYNETITTNEIVNPTQKHSYHQKDPRTLDLVLELSYKEKIGSKVANVFKIGHTHDPKCDLYVSPKLSIPAKDSEIQEFNLKLSDPKDNNYNLLMKWTMTSNVDMVMMLNLQMSPFTGIDMNQIGGEYAMFDLKNKDFSGRKGEGIRAQHLIHSTKDSQQVHLYTAEIVHVVSLQTSLIKISLGGTRLMATANLIGLIHLPYVQHISDKSIMTLDPKFEKAMLVRNLHGDYAIVKGKWIGLRRGVPPRRNKQGIMMRGIPGSPGNLSIEIYSCLKKTIEKAELDQSGVFRVYSEHLITTINLKNGVVEIRFVGSVVALLEVESMLAIIFAISALHVLLQPKEKPMQAGNQGTAKPAVVLSPQNRIGGSSRPVRPYDTSNYMMLGMFGYNELITSDCFIHHCHHHDHHHGDSDNHDHHHGDSDNHDHNHGDSGHHGHGDSGHHGHGHGDSGHHDHDHGDSGHHGHNDYDFGYSDTNNDLNGWLTSDIDSGGGNAFVLDYNGTAGGGFDFSNGNFACSCGSGGGYCLLEYF